MGFLAEFQKLRESVPHPCILNLRGENSDYCPYNNNSKNCYLIMGCSTDEDCFYGYWVGFCQDCDDCAFTERSVLCYECVDVKDCFDCDYCQECRDCSDCLSCFDCVGCHDCAFCVNLRRKQYYILNKKCTKEEYEKMVAGIGVGAEGADLKRKFEELKKKEPHICIQGFNNEDCIGDHIYNCKNAYQCFEVNELEDCMYSANSFQSKNCLDGNYYGWGELNYMCHSAVQDYDCNFCDTCWYSQNLEYCEYVFNSHDCFGCVSLNHAEYQILNEPCASEEEYVRKVRVIKDEMRKSGEYGEMFESQYGEYLAWC